MLATNPPSEAHLESLQVHVSEAPLRRMISCLRLENGGTTGRRDTRR